MPGGRPTTYKPEYCDTVIRIGKKGGWLSQMACACDVSRPTMDEWAKKHPEFSNALDRALQESRAYMESMACERTFNQGHIVPSMWKHLMAARHEDYRESRKVDVTSKGDKIEPTQIILTAAEFDEDDSGEGYDA